MGHWTSETFHCVTCLVLTCVPFKVDLFMPDQVLFVPLYAVFGLCWAFSNTSVQLPYLFEYKARFFSENRGLKVYPRLIFEVNINHCFTVGKGTLIFSLHENVNNSEYLTL